MKLHRRNTSWAHALSAAHCSLPCTSSCGICCCCLHTPATLKICNDSKCCICNAGGGKPVSTEPAQACVPQPHLFRLLALSVHQTQDAALQTVHFQLFLWVLGISSSTQVWYKAHPGVVYGCPSDVCRFTCPKALVWLHYSRGVRQASVREPTVHAMLYRYVVYIRSIV